MMYENGNNFHNVWMKTAGNLRIEIRYPKLKVNFSYCFGHRIFQNQVYKFFGIISWVVLYCRFIDCENSIFALQILEKQLHVFAWPTLHKSRETLSYMWKFTWEKDIGERKGHKPVKKCTFYQYHQIFTVLYPPKICMKRIRPPREI